MSASENSFLGIAKQSAKGTPVTTDANFKYMLFREGAVAPNNVVIPLDMEIGGGAMPRGVVKVGVTSGGALSVIPRPDTLGIALRAALGACAAPAVGMGDDIDVYDHVFTLGTDQFVQPYYTLRSSPGGMWGEQFQDCKMNSLVLNMRAARFLEAVYSFQGGLPTPVSTATWGATTRIDGGPQFLTPIGAIEIPDATAWKVLSASLMITNAMPLDDQWVIGSYVPDDMELVQRAIILQMRVKVSDNGTLYKKMAYDKAGGAAWAANILKEGDIDIHVSSDVVAGAAAGSSPHTLSIAANGESGDDGNVAFSVAPIGLRAGGQVTMNVTGMFLADPTGLAEPIAITLKNNVSTQY
jgi:hypothetical protein